MSDKIDFCSVMSDLRLSMKQKYGNYQCPFCTRKSFTVYSAEQMGHCHNCGWSGDAVKLYSEWKCVSYHEALKELGVALANGLITYGIFRTLQN
jgi:DNA primase (bacterial type)